MSILYDAIDNTYDDIYNINNIVTFCFSVIFYVQIEKLYLHFFNPISFHMFEK